MDKLDKTKVLGAFFILALFAAISGAVSMFCCSVELFKPISGTYEDAYEKIIMPNAIFSLFGSLIAFGGVVLGILSFIVKGGKHKLVIIKLSIAVVAAFVVFIIITGSLWLVWSKNDHYTQTIASTFAYFASAFVLLISQLVYSTIMMVVLILSYKIDKKAETAQPEQIVATPTQTVATTTENDKEILL